MPRLLMLSLAAPLMAFGREMIDQNGPTREGPDASMLTGLVANALGWERGEHGKLQRLQDRLEFGVRIDRDGEELRDFQTAQLSRADRGWTTRGRPEERAGGAATYDSPHIRLRHYRADAALAVALLLQDAQEPPTLEEIALAFDEPMRPLFIGRKPCLPAAPIFVGLVEAEGIVEALLQDRGPGLRLIVSAREADRWMEAAGMSSLRREEQRWTVRRDWRAGVHAGQERRSILTPEAAP
jgi:CRISPR system Cascade subunit CasD